MSRKLTIPKETDVEAATYLVHRANNYYNTGVNDFLETVPDRLIVQRFEERREWAMLSPLWKWSRTWWTFIVSCIRTVALSRGNLFMRALIFQYAHRKLCVSDSNICDNMIHCNSSSLSTFNKDNLGLLIKDIWNRYRGPHKSEYIKRSQEEISAVSYVLMDMAEYLQKIGGLCLGQYGIPEPGRIRPPLE